MKNKRLEYLNCFFSNPLVSILCGYGMFWITMQIYHNVWFSIFIYGYITSLMTILLHNYDELLMSVLEKKNKKK